MKTQLGQHAIVIGASMAGLLTARALSEHFAQVTVLERDPVHATPEARKGQPQARHLHGLLARGFQIMSHYYPTLPDDLVEGGALLGDMGAMMRWHIDGGYRVQFDSGLTGVLMSRPFLEYCIRRRTLETPNITLIDECDVEGPATNDDRTRVTGVHVVYRGEGHGEDQRAATLAADLVVDAAGRGSAAPKWLEQMGYARPEEETIKIDAGYATRIYRRKPGDLIGANLIMIAPEAPHLSRGGFFFAMEDDRWIVALGGWGGDYAPTDEAGFLEYARSLAAPDIAAILPKLEPLSDIYAHRFPANLRRRYERLERFPERYLVLGDALCSFNPVYGQGMTSAALQAWTLDQLLDGRRTLDGLAQPFFKQTAKIVDIPWQTTVGEDFRFATTQGKKAPETDFINGYVNRVNRATHHDTVVYRAFLDVMNLIKPPTSLMHPRIMMRVLRRRPVSAASQTAPERSLAA
jgi:2-polyprenyl-6-methoxyphenol hydroxylase-like FAD-dependent oxidoreductase